MTTRNVQNAWYRFWQDCEMARNHYRALSLFTAGFVPKDLFLDSLLPSQLFAHLMSVLDEGLEIACGDRTLPPGSSADLSGRIEAMRLELPDADSLHRLRERRHELRHDMATYASWNELDNAIPLVEAALLQFELVGERPHLEFYGARTAVEAEEPDHDSGFQYEWGLRHPDGQWALRLESIAWIHSA